MAKSPEDMAQSMIANIPTKTGKPLDDWHRILAASGLDKHGQLMKLLKQEFGVTHGYANLIVQLFRRDGAQPDDEDLVATQYSGPKAGLRPIYDALAAAISELGSDVEFAPRKAYVSLRRRKQFGLIQPSTRTRVDLGLNLKGTAQTDRLEASGSFNAMVSHRVRLSSTDDVDRELIDWLRAAYEAA